MIQSKYLPLTKTEYKVLKYLEAEIYKGEGFYWKKQEVLAKKLNYSKKTINRAVRSLERKKLIYQMGGATAVKKILLVEENE